MSLGVKNSSKELKKVQEMKVNKYMIVFFYCHLFTIHCQLSLYRILNDLHVIMTQFKNN